MDSGSPLMRFNMVETVVLLSAFSSVFLCFQKFASHSPSSLLGFGKVLTRHASLASNLKLDDIVQEGVEHLQNILRANCPHVPASRCHAFASYFALGTICLCSLP